MPEPLACDPLFGRHSEDRASVSHGAAAPAEMCGRHAHYLTPAHFVTMREAGTINNRPNGLGKENHEDS